MSIPQEEIDHILRLAGNRDSGRMNIAAEFSKGKSTEEIAEYLKSTFRGGNIRIRLRDFTPDRSHVQPILAGGLPSLLRQGLLLIPLLYGMHALFGFLGIAAAHMAADMGAALIAALIFAREYRRVKEELS